MNVPTENLFSPPSLFTYEVQANDCDKYEHLNHAECFRILERARWNALGEWGHSEVAVKKMGAGPVIISMEADFRKEILQSAILEISTQAELLNSRFFAIHQSVQIEKSLHMRAKFKHGLFSLESRSLIVLPAAWTNVFESN